MAQTFTSAIPDGSTNVKADNINSRYNENSLISNFSGTSFPNSPVIGQHCCREDMDSREYKWNGTSWVDADVNSETYSDVYLAAGNLPSLTSRLAVSMNDDGTLKASPTAVIDEFKDNALAITYVSTNSFTTPNDLTSTFTQYRKVKCVLGASYVITSVTASTYDGGTNKTTVTLKDSVIDATITAVKYGVIQDGLPGNVVRDAIITMASASVMDIGAVVGNYIIVTGTTTITAFDDTHLSGTVRKLRFSDTVTVTYNATIMLLPGATDIVAYAGDVLEFIHEGSGIWRCTDIQRYKTFRGCSVYLGNVNQSISNNDVPNKVILNETIYDTDNFFNVSSARIEIPIGIKYIKLVAEVHWAESYSTNARRYGLIYKNGTSIAINSSSAFAIASSHCQMVTSAIPVLSGDYFELYVSNSDSVSKNIQYGSISTLLSMEVIA